MSLSNQDSVPIMMSGFSAAMNESSRADLPLMLWQLITAILMLGSALLLVLFVSRGGVAFVAEGSLRLFALEYPDVEVWVLLLRVLCVSLLCVFGLIHSWITLSVTEGFDVRGDGPLDLWCPILSTIIHPLSCCSRKMEATCLTFHPCWLSCTSLVGDTFLHDLLGLCFGLEIIVGDATFPMLQSSPDVKHSNWLVRLIGLAPIVLRGELA